MPIPPDTDCPPATEDEITEVAEGLKTIAMVKDMVVDCETCNASQNIIRSMREAFPDASADTIAFVSGYLAASTPSGP